jgi:uncharacterized membrane protein
MVDLPMSFGEVTHGFFGLFLLISPFGRLEHLIYEILEWVTVPGLMLFPRGGKCKCDTGSLEIHPTWASILVASHLFHRVDGMIRFPILIMSLGQSRLIRVA